MAHFYFFSSYFFFTMTYWVFDAMFAALMSFPSERDVIFKVRAEKLNYLQVMLLENNLFRFLRSKCTLIHTLQGTS